MGLYASPSNFIELFNFSGTGGVDIGGRGGYIRLGKHNEFPTHGLEKAWIELNIANGVTRFSNNNTAGSEHKVDIIPSSGGLQCYRHGHRVKIDPAFGGQPNDPAAIVLDLGDVPAPGLIIDAAATPIGSTPQMYLKSDGNVGVGTNTPDERLDVRGNAVIGDGTSSGNTLFMRRLGGDPAMGLYASPSNFIELFNFSGSGGVDIGGRDGYIRLGKLNESPTHGLERAWIELNIANGVTSFSSNNTAGSEHRVDIIPPSGGLQCFRHGHRVKIDPAFGGQPSSPAAIVLDLGDVPAPGLIIDAAATPIGSTPQMYLKSDGNVGIGTNNPTVKLDVNGSVNCTGGTCSSDLRWKKDITPLENVLERIQKINGVSYYWKKEEFKDKNFDEQQQIGVIAQEVEAVFPELVKTDGEGFKSMDYQSLTAVLLEAIKEQQALIDNQNQRIETLEAQNAKIDNLTAQVKALSEIMNTICQK